MVHIVVCCYDMVLWFGIYVTRSFLTFVWKHHLKIDDSDIFLDPSTNIHNNFLKSENISENKKQAELKEYISKAICSSYISLLLIGWRVQRNRPHSRARLLLYQNPFRDHCSPITQLLFERKKDFLGAQKSWAIFNLCSILKYTFVFLITCEDPFRIRPNFWFSSHVLSWILPFRFHFGGWGNGNYKTPKNFGC